MYIHRMPIRGMFVVVRADIRRGSVLFHLAHIKQYVFCMTHIWERQKLSDAENCCLGVCVAPSGILRVTESQQTTWKRIVFHQIWNSRFICIENHPHSIVISVNQQWNSMRNNSIQTIIWHSHLAQIHQIFSFGLQRTKFDYSIYIVAVMKYYHCHQFVLCAANYSIEHIILEVYIFYYRWHSGTVNEKLWARSVCVCVCMYSHWNTPKGYKNESWHRWLGAWVLEITDARAASGNVVRITGTCS